MKISCSSQSMDSYFANHQMDLFSYIQYAAEIKLDAVEFEDKHFENLSPEYLSNVKNACAENGVEIANVAFFNSFGFPTSAENDEQYEKAVKFMDATVLLGSKNMRIFAGWMNGPNLDTGFEGSIRPKTEEAWNTMIAYIKKVCKTAKEKGLNIVIENHNHGGFLSVSDDVLWLFEEVDADNLSLLLDTGNFADGIPGIEKTIHLTKYHAHLKCRDIQPDGTDTAFDLVKILEIFKNNGFDGNISLEYEGTQDSKTVLPQLVELVRKTVK